MKLYDLTRYRNHGTLTNMAPRTDWVQTERGIALDFDGVDDYVIIGDKDLYHGMTEITVSCAALRRSTSIHVNVLHKYWDGSNRSWLSEFSTGRWRWLVATDIENQNNNIYSAVVPENTWSHMTGTWAGSDDTLRLYVDGDLVASGSSNGNTVRENTESVIFGANYSGTTEYLNGQIAYGAIWRRRLNDDETRWLRLEFLRGFPTLLNRRRFWYPKSAYDTTIQLPEMQVAI